MNYIFLLNWIIDGFKKKIRMDGLLVKNLEVLNN